MGQVGQLYYNMISPNGQTISSEGLDIYTEIIGAQGYIKPNIIKLGIQAPMGTKVKLNEKEILIGRTGMYELDEIKITSMYFIQPYEYEFNSNEARDALNTKNTAIEDANDARQDAINGLDINAEDYYSKFEEIEKKYQQAINNALILYEQNIKNAYTQGSLKELTNVIIDYITEG